MGEISQTIYGEAIAPADGIYGNCFQAALASLLNMPLDAVPHFLTFIDFQGALRLWLGERGIETVRLTTDKIPAAGSCLVSGNSPRGLLHVVVAKDGEIVWDPHPDRSGIDEVMYAWTFSGPGFEIRTTSASPLASPPMRKEATMSERATVGRCTSRFTMLGRGYWCDLAEGHTGSHGEEQATWTDGALPRVGTPEFYAARARGWNQKADAIVQQIVAYEECHPDDAVCLWPLVGEAARVMARHHQQRADSLPDSPLTGPLGGQE